MNKQLHIYVKKSTDVHHSINTPCDILVVLNCIAFRNRNRERQYCGFWSLCNYVTTIILTILVTFYLNIKVCSIKQLRF